MEYNEFCEQTYKETYKEKYKEKVKLKKGKSAKKDAERVAQRTAIKRTFELALEEYGDKYEAAELWRAIYVAHLKRKADISDFLKIDEDVIKKVISADQSWKKASGHAFESFIVDRANSLLDKTGIKFALQVELTSLLKKDLIHNQSEDLEWIKQRVHTNAFDLYAILSYMGKNYVFGCIQSKTSIRDRVGRDREPSQQAMKKLFWSIAVDLDGGFLAMPKFIEMVNGGGNDYETNGWHGMYVMSKKYSDDRIFPVDGTLKLLTDHAKLAAQYWISSRQRFDSTWRP